MDPITGLGAAAAGTQFALYGIKSIIGLISLAKQLHDTPSSIRQLLGESEASVCRLKELESKFKNRSDELTKRLTLQQRDALLSVVVDGCTAVHELCDILSPLSRNPNGTSHTGIAKATNAFKGLYKNKDIEGKLERIQRCNNEILRQLQMAGLEHLSSSIADIHRQIELLDPNLEEIKSTSSTTLHETRQINNEIVDIRHLVAQHNTSTQSGILALTSAIQGFRENSQQQWQQIATSEQMITMEQNLKQYIMDVMNDRSGKPMREAPAPNNLAPGPDGQGSTSSELTWAQRAVSLRQSARLNAPESPNMPGPPSVPAPYRTRTREGKKKKKQKAIMQFSFALRLYPWFRKTFIYTAGLAPDGEGYGFYQSIKPRIVIKRSESLAIQALDDARGVWLGTHAQDSSQACMCILRDRLRSLARTDKALFQAYDEEGVSFLQNVINWMRRNLVDQYTALEEIQDILSLFEDMEYESEQKHLQSNLSPQFILSHLTPAIAMDLIKLSSFYLSTSSPLVREQSSVERLFEACEVERFEKDLDISQVFPLWNFRKIEHWDIALREWAWLQAHFATQLNLATSIARRNVDRVLSVFEEYPALLCRTDEEIRQLTSGYKDHLSPMRHIWPFGFTPLALAVGWPQGLRCILAAGAMAQSAITSAVQQQYLESLKILLDPSWTGAATIDEIWEGCLYLYPTNPEVIKIAAEATKLRMVKIYDLAQNHATTSAEEMNIDNGPLLDSKAFEVYQNLNNPWVQLPRGVTMTNDAPFYNRLFSFESTQWDATRMSEALTPDVLDWIFNLGFHEIDMIWKDKTPLQSITDDIFTLWHPRIPLWLLRKGAIARVGELWLGPEARIFSVARQFWQWFIYPQDPREHAEKAAIACLEHFSRGQPLHARDTCSCYCSSSGCLPSHAILSNKLEFASYVSRGNPLLQRWSKTRVLMAWASIVDGSETQVREFFEDSCRMEVFDRLEMRHTCGPHVPEVEGGEIRSALAKDELHEIWEEDKQGKMQLDLLMEAYSISRAAFLPTRPTVSDYADHLEYWWQELDIILPDVPPKGHWLSQEDVRAERDHRALKALEEAGYLQRKSEYADLIFTDSLFSDTLNHSHYEEVPDFAEIIRRHFWGERPNRSKCYEYGENISDYEDAMSEQETDGADGLIEETVALHLG